MRYRDYAHLAEVANRSPRPARCAVAGAADPHALDAVFRAAAAGYVTPVLVGPTPEIHKTLTDLDLPPDAAGHLLVDCAAPEAARVAVELVHAGEADFILKGHLETRDLLRPILDKRHGLCRSGFVTHLGLMQIRGYHKLLALSDAAVVPYPTLEDKARIVRVCSDALQRLGIDRPVVGALASIEVPNPALVECVEARALQEMAERGELGDCEVIGPISYDLATSREAAELKGYDHPHAGDVDMLLVPQMVTGNVISKIFNADPANILGGCLVGTDVPVALTSRAAGTAEKLHSLLLCSLLSHQP